MGLKELGEKLDAAFSEAKDRVEHVIHGDGPEKTRMEQAIDRLRALQKISDAELAHSEADEVLCDMLNELGCQPLVAEWRKVLKWYA